MTRNQKLGVILGFYAVTHTAVAWVMGNDTMLVRLATVFVLVACVIKDIRYALNVLAGTCGLFAISGVVLLMRLESDWPIYTAVTLYISASAAFAWWLLQPERQSTSARAAE